MGKKVIQGILEVTDGIKTAAQGVTIGGDVFGGELIYAPSTSTILVEKSGDRTLIAVEDSDLGLHNLAEPQSELDAATKKYVDSVKTSIPKNWNELNNRDSEFLVESSICYNTPTLTFRPYVFDTAGNRMYGINPQRIVVEQSTDAGQTWTFVSLTEWQKNALFDNSNTTQILAFPKTCQAMFRVTCALANFGEAADAAADSEKMSLWTASNYKAASLYCNCDRFYVYVGGPDRTDCWVQTAAAPETGNEPSWTDRLNLPLARGWNGGNTSSTQSSFVLGGNKTQSPLIRFIFRYNSSDGNYDDSKLQNTTEKLGIMNIRLFGNTIWQSANHMMRFNTPYVNIAGYPNRFAWEGNLQPSTNGIYDLGLNYQRWNNVHSNYFYENGTLLSDKYAAKTHTHSYNDLTNKPSNPTTIPTNANEIIYNNNVTGLGDNVQDAIDNFHNEFNTAQSTISTMLTPATIPWSNNQVVNADEVRDFFAAHRMIALGVDDLDTTNNGYYTDYFLNGPYMKLKSIGSGQYESTIYYYGTHTYIDNGQYRVRVLECKLTPESEDKVRINYEHKKADSMSVDTSSGINLNEYVTPTKVPETWVNEATLDTNSVINFIKTHGRIWCVGSGFDPDYYSLEVTYFSPLSLIKLEGHTSRLNNSLSQITGYANIIYAFVIDENSPENCQLHIIETALSM